MRHLTAQEKKLTFATTMKGFNKIIVDALKKMQAGEEKEMGAERTWELDEAKRDIQGSIDDVIQFAEAILHEAKMMKELY